MDDSNAPARDSIVADEPLDNVPWEPVPLKRVQPNLEAEGRADNVPQFGLIDVVEAFTALRHEYRSQVKETRELAEQLQGSTLRIQNLESALVRIANSVPGADSQANEQTDKFAQTLIEFDIQLSRAVEAAMADENLRRSRQKDSSEELDRAIARLSKFSRWFAKPVVNVIQLHRTSELKDSSPVVDGLAILLSKLRQSLNDHGVERIETQGEPFNGETMKSIGVLQVEGVPTGHVAEQLSPTYSQGGKALKFAAVRVAP